MRKLLKLTNGANRRPDRAMGDETTPCGQLLSLCSVLPYGSHNDVTLLSVGTLAQPTSERSAVRPENRGFVMKTVTGKSEVGIMLSLAGVLSVGAPKARADEQQDPPTRVARISYVDGSVSLQPGGEGDWGSAARNRPVTIGDKLWVDKDSRAELQAGPAAIHLGSITALSFLNLDQGITQMRLAEGSINFRVSELREGDLDDYGTWRDEPEYGHVWYPAQVDPGWAPYSSGYWNWVGPWGWTWVDYSPWGFAPFHYGRWNYFAGGWGWCPGPVYGPPIYGPAFVGFLGGGFGFIPAFAFREALSCFPLAFAQPFFP